jgi:hypothetical protein
VSAKLRRSVGGTGRGRAVTCLDDSDALVWVGHVGGTGRGRAVACVGDGDALVWQVDRVAVAYARDRLVSLSLCFCRLGCFLQVGLQIGQLSAVVRTTHSSHSLMMFVVTRCIASRRQEEKRRS